MRRFTRLSAKLIAQDLPTMPKVGRKPVMPVRDDGNVMDPAVSDPIANGTLPATIIKVEFLSS